jgi:hypothetical protein
MTGVMSVALKPLKGMAITYDGLNIGEIKKFCGDDFLDVAEQIVLIRGGDGRPTPVVPGRSIVKWDEVAFLVVFSPAAFRAQVNRQEG